ncbi:superinfection immunity protein [Nanoarchaeota archaeon]
MGILAFIATLSLAMIIGGILAYFLPTIIALARNHSRKGLLFVLNLLTGWTFLGWIGCLIWSIADR